MTQPAPIHPFDAPPAYLQIKNWLGAERVARLLAYAEAHRTRFRPSGVIMEGVPTVDTERRISEKLASIGEVAGEIEGEVRAALPEIFRTLGTPPFSPSFETELVAHGNGAHYKIHQDIRPGMQRDRAISGVYYFHREPKGFSGGQLRLHALAAPGKPGTFADIEPENDTVVFFPSWFPHEVLPVRCPSGAFMDARFAVNCWLHR